MSTSLSAKNLSSLILSMLHANMLRRRIFNISTFLSLYAKKLERGRFVWPQAQAGAVALTPAALAVLLEGIDWRHPQRTWRPEAAG